MSAPAPHTHVASPAGRSPGLPPSEPLAKPHSQLLKERFTRAIEFVPSYVDLRNRLLDLGGDEIVPMVFPRSTAVQIDRQRSDIAKVLQNGRTWPGEQAKMKMMEGSACHRNAAKLCASGRGSIATGWALSDDGLWREHTWIVRKPGTGAESLIETTFPRVLYHGYLLDELETAFFIFSELGKLTPEMARKVVEAVERGEIKLEGVS